MPVDLTVPARPAVFQGTDRKFHLAYELHITNFSKAELLLRQVEVIDGSTGTVLAGYSGKELGDRLRSLAGLSASQSLPGGSGAVVFIWLDFTNAKSDIQLRCPKGNKIISPAVAGRSPACGRLRTEDIPHAIRSRVAQTYAFLAFVCGPSHNALCPAMERMQYRRSPSDRSQACAARSSLTFEGRRHIGRCSRRTYG
jgi:hypothetical protein